MGIRHGAIALLAAWMLTAGTARAQDVPAACHGDGAAAVACIVNEGRAAMGLRKLRTHPILTAAAQRYAERMAREGFFSHTDPEGNGPLDRLVAAGYGERRRGRRWRAGEVLGRGTQVLATPQALAFSWFSSPRHRRVVLDRRFRHVGVGVAVVPAPLGALPERRYVLYAGVRR